MSNTTLDADLDISFVQVLGWLNVFLFPDEGDKKELGHCVITIAYSTETRRSKAEKHEVNIYPKRKTVDQVAREVISKLNEIKADKKKFDTGLFGTSYYDFKVQITTF